MDFLEHLLKHRDGRNNRHRNYYDGNYYQRRTEFHDHGRHLIQKLLFNKKLLITAAVILGLLLILGFALILVLIPLLYKLFGYIGQDGLKGILDWLIVLITKLWEGGGKP